jgi:hypothetical protein
MFDGLDEISRPEARAASVAGSNRRQRFGRGYGLPLVVATRRYEYETLTERLELENAVEILPFPPDLVEQATLQITCPTSAWTIPTPPDPQIRAMILAEIYRHTVDGQQIWKLRAVGQGWADGLGGLARDHGADVA